MPRVSNREIIQLFVRRAIPDKTTVVVIESNCVRCGQTIRGTVQDGLPIREREHAEKCLAQPVIRGRFFNAA
jgi:hypothetical protein